MPRQRTRPSPIRIDDLADPRFDDEVVEMMRGGAALATDIDFTVDGLRDSASAATGLGDFDDDAAFDERLDVLVTALRDEAGLSDFGRVTTAAQIVQLLKNRLLLTDLLDRHPQINDIEISRPIIVAGLPRTGTTHLHNLLAANPALRSLPYWESLEPVPPASGAADPDAPDPRLARTEAGLTFLDLAAPHFKRMHEMTVDHVHEEIQLLAIDMSSMLFETMAPMPSLRDHYLSHDQTPHYRYLETVLKALTWLRGGERWVLKSPQHIEQFQPLMTVFPDATVLVTHRDPVAVTVPVCTMITYSSRLHLDPVDPVHIGGYWADRIERMLAACTRDREVVPPERSMDIRFEDFMSDDMGTVAAAYELADQPFDASTRDATARYVEAHPRGRHGGVIYDMAEFELDEDERRAALGFYIDRFLGASEGATTP